MLHKTRGIVFQSIKYSESSNIVKIYTEAFGLKSYMVRGLRTSKSKKNLSKFQHLSLLDMVVYQNDKKNLQNIKEVKSAFVFNSIPFDIVKSSMVLFLNEMLLKSIKEEESNPELFGFLFDSILGLDQLKKPPNNFHLLFALQLTKHLGFFPQSDDENAEVFDLQEGRFVQRQPFHPDFIEGHNCRLFKNSLSVMPCDCNLIQVSNKDRMQLLATIVHYFKLHVPGFGTLKSIEVLHAIFS
jgi:DNA repair protein RecO (recombination protein O)